MLDQETTADFPRIDTVLFNGEKIGLFLPEADPRILASIDVWIGAVERETDTACGVLGVKIAKEEEGALEIGILMVPEEYRGRGVKEALLKELLTLAEVLHAAAVFDTELIREDEENDAPALLKELGFFEEEKKLSLYEFLLSDLRSVKEQTGLGCVRLSQLSGEQWSEFRKEAENLPFLGDDPSDYDDTYSIFLMDDEKRLQGGLLLRIREETLFVEGIAAYGRDEEALLNDLVFWGLDGVKKRLSPDTRFNLFLPSGRTYLTLLSDLTGKKAVKKGSLVNFTYEVPVSKGLEFTR